MALGSIVFFLTASSRNPVREFFDDLSEADATEVLAAISNFAQEFPTVTTVTIKHLQGKLWEMKIARFRVLYGVGTDSLLIVHAFTKKSQKTPKNDLDLAAKRLAQMLEE